MNTLLTFLSEAWSLTAAMAPWLLLGFGIAGLCGQILPQNFIEKHLAKRSFGSLLKAVFIGTPLPICSCGVIPVAAGLRKQGASKGAVAAFTAATPQTGVDSIAATYSLMGLPFTLARLLATFISGMLAGVLINALPSKNEQEQTTSKPTDNSPQLPITERLRAALHDGFVKLPADLAKNLALGIFIGALISTFIPANALEAYLSTPLLAYLVITLISVPLYTCATGSIPLAFSLLHAGFSPGVALVFLITGPATNSATFFTLVHIIGSKETLIYLCTIIFGAWVVAYGFDTLFPNIQIAHGTHEHTMETSPTGHIFAATLVLISLHALWRKASS